MRCIGGVLLGGVAAIALAQGAQGRAGLLGQARVVPLAIVSGFLVQIGVGHVLHHATVGALLGHAVAQRIGLRHDVLAGAHRIGGRDLLGRVVGLGHVAVLIHRALLIALQHFNLRVDGLDDVVHLIARAVGHSIAGEDLDGLELLHQGRHVVHEGLVRRAGRDVAIGVHDIFARVVVEGLHLLTESLHRIGLAQTRLLIAGQRRQVGEHRAGRGAEVLDTRQQRRHRRIGAGVHVVAHFPAVIEPAAECRMAEQVQLALGQVVQRDLVAQEQRVGRVEHDGLAVPAVAVVGRAGEVPLLRVDLDGGLLFGTEEAATAALVGSILGVIVARHHRGEMVHMH